MNVLPGMPWPLPWPFDRSYMQLALVAGVVVGATAPLIGVFVVQKGQSLVGDGLGHVAVAGIGAALLFNTSPTWTAMAFAVVAALVIEWLRSRGSTTGDLALALVFYGGIAAGVVLASRSATNTNLQPYLFGSILTATANDVWTVIALGVLIVVAVAFTGRALLAVVLDEDAARVSGIPAACVEHPARGAHRGDRRRGDAHRGRAADRRAHGAAGRDQPAARSARSAARCSARWA